MDGAKTNLRKNLFVKAWERCKSVGSTGSKKSSNVCHSLTKSKTWNGNNTSFARSVSPIKQEEIIKKRTKKNQVTPKGFFSVYVGEEKQRFMIKTEFANHPLFNMLLEDAEMEYGYNSQGPLLLPCDVDLFYKVLAEMDSGEEISSTKSNSLLILCSPASCYSNKSHSSYQLLTPSKMLKLNRI